MTPECERVLDCLDGPLPPELASHAAGCADCRALLDGFQVLAPPAVAPPPVPINEAKLEQTRRQSLTELAAQPLPTPWWKEVAVLLATYL
ncbi:DUF1109 domain-containing protein, partial [Corallococcus exercitus]